MRANKKINVSVVMTHDEVAAVLSRADGTACIPRRLSIFSRPPTAAVMTKGAVSAVLWQCTTKTDSGKGVKIPAAALVTGL
jgi:hypothetical protein